MQATSRLEEARSAYERRDWLTARDAYRAAAADTDLAAGDRHALARCHWWLGDLDACREDLEKAHRSAVEDGEPTAAAAAALELGLAHLLGGNEPVGSGWIGRAARLVEELPDSPIHGYLTLVFEVEPDFGDVDPARAVEAARRVRDAGGRCGDPTLVAAGLHAEGRALIRNGEVAAGMALLDEAMVAVVAGEVDDTWAGHLYCATIAACHELGDFHRMARWTEAVQRWLSALPAAALFGADCRVHRAQLLTLRGDWDGAEQEAVRASEELAGISVLNAAEAWYEVGEVRRRRGDLRGAEAAYRSANELGLDPQPGLALLRLAQGRYAVAATSIRTALLTACAEPVGRARLCAAQVEIAVAGDELELAWKACEELTDTATSAGSPGLLAMAAAARGAVHLAAREPEQALGPLREASRLWRELGAPHEAARTGVLLARTYAALGDEEAARRELDAANPVFARLGAVVDAAKVRELRGSTRAGGLSDRELEVLRLVAAGRSNRQIADALYISDKTVARHMSNILTKLGVTSRTGAARYAFEQRLFHGLSD